MPRIISRASALALLALSLSIMFGIAGQLLMKWAALRTVGGIMDLTSISLLAVALLVYSIGILNWILALGHLPLSIAYPVTSLSYIGILWGSHYWFGERISMPRAIGVGLIFFGVLLIVLRWSRPKPSDDGIFTSNDGSHV